jgi:hypothetical protein
MNIPPPVIACLEAIAEWSDLRQLAYFALARHGFCNSNNGTGMNFPEDLDPYRTEVEGVQIPIGFVLIFVLTDPEPGGYETLVPEHLYFSVLADILAESNFRAEATKIRELANLAKEKLDDGIVQQINSGDALRRC